MSDIRRSPETRNVADISKEYHQAAIQLKEATVGKLRMTQAELGRGLRWGRASEGFLTS